MSTDLVSTTPDECFALAERVSRSQLVPQAYRGKPIDAAIAMMYGAEMGLPPMTALQRVVVINGKPTLDAQGMVALIRQAGHSVSGQVDSDKATIEGKRGDNGDAMTITFTMADAEKAELLKNATYRKFPTDMLWARAVTQLGRRLFADVLMGASYAPEEMQAVVGDNEATSEPAPEVVTVRPPPNAVQADAETGEIAPTDDGIIDAEVVPPEADAQMHELADLIATTKPAKERDRLKECMRQKFGESKEMPPEMLPDAIAYAAGWPHTAPDPVEAEMFQAEEAS